MSEETWIQCEDRHHVRWSQVDVAQTVDSYKGKSVRLRVNGQWYVKNDCTADVLILEVAKERRVI